MQKPFNIRQLRKTYTHADAKGRALLEEACGSEIFTSDVTDRVTDVRSACEELGRDFNVEFSSDRISTETPDETGYREWKIIAEALNEGEEVDYYNPKQKKWTLWVEYIASGRGLAVRAVSYVSSGTGVGPRLCFLNEKHARYFFNQFPETIKKFFSHNNK